MLNHKFFFDHSHESRVTRFGIGLSPNGEAILHLNKRTLNPIGKVRCWQAKSLVSNVKVMKIPKRILLSLELPSSTSGGDRNVPPVSFL